MNATFINPLVEIEKGLLVNRNEIVMVQKNGTSTVVWTQRRSSSGKEEGIRCHSIDDPAGTLYQELRRTE